MLVQSYTMVLAAADDDNVSTSQTPGAAGNLTITGAAASGGVATFDVARRVLVTTASNESAKTLTIYGTDRYGNSISESMTGPNATTGYTSLDFLTVTRVAVSAAFTGAVKVGTNGVASGAWLNRNLKQANFLVGVQVTLVTGSANFDVQYTMDDPNVLTTVPTATTASGFSGATASTGGSIAIPHRATRLLINSGTGTLRINVIQSGPA